MMWLGRHGTSRRSSEQLLLPSFVRPGRHPDAAGWSMQTRHTPQQPITTQHGPHTANKNDTSISRPISTWHVSHTTNQTYTQPIKHTTHTGNCDSAYSLESAAIADIQSPDKTNNLFISLNSEKKFLNRKMKSKCIDFKCVQATNPAM